MHSRGYLQIHLMIYLQIHGRIFTNTGRFSKPLSRSALVSSVFVKLTNSLIFRVRIFLLETLFWGVEFRKYYCILYHNDSE